MSEIYTGYEIYALDSQEIDIDASMQSIQDAMFERNPEKYGDFLGTLDKTRNALYGMYHPVQYFQNLFSNKLEDKTKLPLTIKLSEDPVIEMRLKLFRCIYYAMRLIDDIVDGDTTIPLEPEERIELIKSILSGNTEHIKNPLYKALSIRIQELSEKLGKKEEIQEALHQIITSIKFDLDRSLDDKKTRTKEELQENFHRMDIVGTIVGTAVIFGIKTDNIVDFIEPLGEACRVMYNLRDFGEDLYAELLNIPEEELKEFNISEEDLGQVKKAGKDINFGELPDCIKKWFQSEISKINSLMKQHEKNMRQNSCEFEDNPNFFSKKWRNFVLKNMVFPRAYVKEIKERVPQILGQVS